METDDSLLRWMTSLNITSWRQRELSPQSFPQSALVAGVKMDLLEADVILLFKRWRQHYSESDDCVSHSLAKRWRHRPSVSNYCYAHRLSLQPISFDVESTSSCDWLLLTPPPLRFEKRNYKTANHKIVSEEIQQSIAVMIWEPIILYYLHLISSDRLAVHL